MSHREHWENVYGTRAPDQVSWFQREGTVSLALATHESVDRHAPAVDIGAGASTVVDGLLAAGFIDIDLLELSAAALALVRRRLGGRLGADSASPRVGFIEADVTAWRPPRSYGLWHDRAVFHFLVDQDERARYRRVLGHALRPGATAVIGTFSLEGPERCSGLPVRRYSAETLSIELEGLLRPVEVATEVHNTPSGATQSFVFVRFVRV